MKDYQEFLENKLIRAADSGFDVDTADLNSQLFDWQRVIVQWALRKGKAALFEECGLGKTFQELEWSRLVCLHTGGNVLILCPFAVEDQTRAEAEKFGIIARVVGSQSEVQPGISIAHYDILHKLNPGAFVGVVLDESSILKNFTGATKRKILEAFRTTPYRLCATATPAPNDHLELGNHADFLDVMPSNEMISRWFINDTMAAGSYRLKEHGAADYWRWVCSWAVAIDKPSDMGYSDDGFVLPPLNMIYHPVDVDISDQADGNLFRMDDISATSLHRELRLTTDDRADKAAEIRHSIEGPSIFWCNANYEADALMRRIAGAVEVRGDMKPEVKKKRLLGFPNGEFDCMVTKPSIAAFGLNYQHCSDQVFVGLSYSYEQMYQALRRSYRFGQTKPVNAHVIYATTEGNIRAAIDEKAAKHQEMKRAMVEAMRETQIEEFKAGRVLRIMTSHTLESGDAWEMHHGDSVEVLATLPADSIDLSIWSPPFSNLYIYSDSVRDMGNCADDAEFIQNLEFMLGPLYRVTRPGRLAVVHCKDLPLYKNRDGAFGLSDFPGMLIQAMKRNGFVFQSRCTIWKDPVIEMQRTKNHGLLYKELCKDSTVSRQGMADYMLAFRRHPKDGEIVNEVTSGAERFDYYVGMQPPDASRIAMDCNALVPSQVDGKWPKYNPFPFGSEAYRLWSIEVWQKYASPVWFDIQQTAVLNSRMARAQDDEKHICPLQLDLIERACHLWSNPGDTILSPFAGIGSEGVGALRCGRRFIGIELKEEYWRTACRFLKDEETALNAQMRLAI